MRKSKKGARPRRAVMAGKPSLTMSAARAPSRSRAIVALLPICALGALVAGYMVVAHLKLFHGAGSFESLCNFGQRLSCDAVNTSDESEVFGFAVALLALPAYAAFASLAVIALRGDGARRRFALALAHVLAWPAAAYSAYLLAVMVFKLGTLCLFCLTLDAVTAAVLVLTGSSAGEGPLALARVVRGGFRSEARAVVAPTLAIAAGVFVLGVFGHERLRASLEADARALVLAGAEPSARPAPSGAALDDSAEEAPPSGARKLPTKRWEVPVDPDDAAVGPEAARVVVVQFADFQCGYCKKLENAMAAVRRAFASEVRFVFKHFPMNPQCNGSVQNEKHKYACEAAASAECARRQGKFWPMHDDLYKNQHRLERRDLDHYAERVGLDMGQFAACMGDPSALEAVRKDAEDGGRVKVNGTPRTFINGRLFGGVLSEDLLSFVIRIELGQVSGKAAEAYAAPSAAPVAPGLASTSPPVPVAYGGLKFEIDPFEASIDASGKAVSLPGREPAEVTYEEAKQACEKAGKRLCTSEEWVSACQGARAVDDDGDGDFADDYIEGTQYPYADWYEPGFCHDAEDASKASAGLTGSRLACRTPSGVYDLAGNAPEWVGSAADRASLLGGGATDREKAACYRPKRRDGAGAKGGVRCCK